MGARIELVGVFGTDITLETVHAQLSAIPSNAGNVEVYIDSNGGSIYTAMRIWELMKSFPFWYNAVGKVVQSAATYIYFNIYERSVAIDAPPNWLLIHEVTAPALPEGLTADELEWYAKMLRAFQNKLAELYSYTFNVPIEVALQQMKDNTSWTPEEAKLQGVAAHYKFMSETKTPWDKLAEGMSELTTAMKAFVSGAKNEAPAEPPAEEGGAPGPDEMEALKAELAAAKEELAKAKAMCEDYENQMKAMKDGQAKVEALVAQVTNQVTEIQKNQSVGGPAAGKITGGATASPSGNPAIDQLQAMIDMQRKPLVQPL